jgi:hypothetical protein
MPVCLYGVQLDDLTGRVCTADGGTHLRYRLVCAPYDGPYDTTYVARRDVVTAQSEAPRCAQLPCGANSANKDLDTCRSMSEPMDWG